MKLKSRTPHKEVLLDDDDLEGISDHDSAKSSGHGDVDNIFDDIDSVDDDSDDDHSDHETQFGNAEVPIFPDKYGSPPQKSISEAHRSFMANTASTRKTDLRVVGSMKTLLKPEEKDALKQQQSPSSSAVKSSPSFLFLSKLTDSFRSPKPSFNAAGGVDSRHESDAVSVSSSPTVNPKGNLGVVFQSPGEVSGGTMSGKWNVDKNVSTLTASTLNNLNINIGTAATLSSPNTQKRHFIDRMVTDLLAEKPIPKAKPVKKQVPTELTAGSMFSNGELIKSKISKNREIKDEDFKKLISPEPSSSMTKNQNPGATSFKADLSLHDMILSNRKKYDSNDADHEKIPGKSGSGSSSATNKSKSSSLQQLPDIVSSPPGPQMHPLQYDSRNPAHQLSASLQDSQTNHSPLGSANKMQHHSAATTPSGYRSALNSTTRHFLSCWTNKTPERPLTADEKQLHDEMVSKYAVRGTAGEQASSMQCDPYNERSVPVPHNHTFVSNSSSALSQSQSAALGSLRVPKLEIYDAASPKRPVTDNKTIYGQFYNYPSADPPMPFNAPDISDNAAIIADPQYRFSPAANSYMHVDQTNNFQYGMYYRDPDAVHPHQVVPSERHKEAVRAMTTGPTSESSSSSVVALPVIFVPHKSIHGNALVPSIDDLIVDHPSQVSRNSSLKPLVGGHTDGVRDYEDSDDENEMFRGRSSKHDVKGVLEMEAGVALAGSTYSEVWDVMSNHSKSTSNVIAYQRQHHHPNMGKELGRHYSSDNVKNKSAGLEQVHKQSEFKSAVEDKLAISPLNRTLSSMHSLKTIPRNSSIAQLSVNSPGDEEDNDNSAATSPLDRQLLEEEGRAKLRERLLSRYSNDKEGDFHKAEKVKKYLQDGQKHSKAIMASYLQEVEQWHPTKEVIHEH